MGSIKYSLREPFERAVELIRQALEIHGLRVAGQMDVATRVERHLGVVLPPCKILYVLPNAPVLSSDTVHPWAAVFLPVHIVVSGNDGRSEIEVPNKIHSRSQPTDRDRVAPIVETQARITAALEAIAMRLSFV